MKARVRAGRMRAALWLLAAGACLGLGGACQRVGMFCVRRSIRQIGFAESCARLTPAQTSAAGSDAGTVQ